MPHTHIPVPTQAERAVQAAKECASSKATPAHWHALMNHLENLAIVEKQHAEVRAAVLNHHHALDRRAHGSMVAMRLVEDVCKALGMPWVRSATLSAPLAICSQCGRRTWDASEVDDWCNASQPNGTRCPGLMASPAAAS